MVNRQAKPLWRDAVQPRKAASCSLDVIHPRHFRGRSLRNISIRLSSPSPILAGGPWLREPIVNHHINQMRSAVVSKPLPQCWCEII